MFYYGTTDRRKDAEKEVWGKIKVKQQATRIIKVLGEEKDEWGTFLLVE